MFRETTALEPPFHHRSRPDLQPHRGRLEIPVGLEGGGVSAGDFDGDGLADLYFAGDGGGRLYRNEKGKLRDASAAAGLRAEGESRAGYFVDYDNDGDRDLFVTMVLEPNRLYENDGRGRFREVAAERGLQSGRDITHEAVWFDMENDGLLDVYTAHFGPWTDGIGPRVRELNENGGPNRLHLHRLQGGAHRFQEAAAALGVADPGWTHCVGATDLDRDGYPDLFSLNDFGHSRVFRNNRGRGFQEAAAPLGLDLTYNAMNFCLLDLEGDGRLSIYVTQIGRRPPRSAPASLHPPEEVRVDLRPLVTNRLYTPGPDGVYRDLHQARIEPADMGWAWFAGGFDYENDGDLDLLVLNGTEEESPASAPGAPEFHLEGRMVVARNSGQRNVLFIAEGGCLYDASSACPLAYPGNSRGAAFFDLEGDGDLDVAINDYQAPARVFENLQAAGNRWVRFHLEGTRSNRDAVGARVEVRFAGRTRAEQVVSGSGFLSQSPLVLHFGLGRAEKVDEATITWPSGKTERRTGLAANTLHHLREPPR